MSPAALPLFDPRTIIGMASVMSLLLAGVIFFLRRIYPPSIHGLLQWAIAPALCLVSTVLFAARGFIPDPVSSAGGNLTLFGAAIFLYIGSQRFYGLAPSDRLCAAVLAVAAPVFVWFAAVDPRFGVRVVLITLLMAWILLTHAHLLLSKGKSNAFSRMTGYLLIVQSVVLILRMVDALLGSATTALLEPSGSQIAYLMAYVFTFLLMTVGLILMAAERMRVEFEHQATHDSLTLALSEALNVAERIRTSRTQVPALPLCTVSIGVACNEDGADTIATLLARADAGLYRAKNRGRNRVEASMAS